MDWITSIVVILTAIVIAVYSYNSGYKNGANRVLDIWKLEVRKGEQE